MLKPNITSRIKIRKNKPPGIIELLSASTIRGWVLDDGTNHHLSLEWNGTLHRLPLERAERADVTQQYGNAHRLAGFACAVPDDLHNTIQTFIDRKQIPKITIGGKPLQCLPSAMQRSDIAAHIDRTERFSIEGWAVHDRARPSTLELRAGERVFPLRPVWLERQDVADRLGIEMARVGFVAELPGYVWDSSTGGQVPEALTLQLQVDGEPLNDSFRLTRQQVVDWVNSIGADEENQYPMLCAIEHVYHGDLGDALPTAVFDKLRTFAARFGLENQVTRKLGASAPGGATPWHTARLWRGLRELNASLAQAETADEVWEASLAVAESLSRQVRAAFFDSISPTLCRWNLYDRLREREDVDFDRWRDWEDAGDPWKLTLALPAWLAARRLDKASEILERLTRHLDGNGWINTECLHYVARQAMALSLKGKIGREEIESFICSYLGVLDAFKGDWHSRLYDELLMAGACEFLDGFERYTDHLQQDLTHGLLRHYGLSATFWQSTNELPGPFHEDPKWIEARSKWNMLDNGLGQSGNELDWSVIVSALRYFDRVGNPEARRHAREILGPRLAEINADASHPGWIALDFLLEDPLEGVRYAAFPLPSASHLHERHAVCGPRLVDTLRRLTQRQKDPAFGAHRQLGIRIAALAQGLRNDAAAATDETQSLVSRLSSEATQGDALAIDLLSWLVSNPNVMQDPDALALALMDRLAEQPDTTLLAAPLQAALARIMRVLPPPLAQDVAALTASKWGSRIPRLPQEGTSLAMRATQTDWPGDTLVVIYSCRKYLDSRIDAIRETWLKDLVERGIPYLVVVGDGDDAIEGDILTLDVSDRYEDLPLKTLKLVDWVYERSDFQYLYKIDDDCYLDVERFFDNLSYRRHHYYGRVIKRGKGSMDRTWHQSKSHSEHARNSLDKSPEPSTYADGGGGWVLSRQAMQILRTARDTEAGQRLVAVSMMEDKLVGDLLALGELVPSDEEYESYQRRRTFGQAIPVGMRENLFFPNALTPTVMCHLDTETDQAPVHSLRTKTELWPKKVWPTCDPVRLDWESKPNQLELLSSEKRLWELLAVPVFVVSVMRNEMTMLPHFLKHYRDLGVECFLIADNCSDDGTREYLLEQPDVILFSTDTEYKDSHYGVAWQQAILGNFCLGRWALLADADELLIYPGYEKLPLIEFLNEVEAESADSVRVGMIDMYPYGDLDEADFSQQEPFIVAPWFDQQPLVPWHLGSGYYSNNLSHVSALRHRVDPNAEPNAFNSLKTALVRYRPWMHFSKGLHEATGVNVSTQRAWFAHFKYHAGFKAKVEAEVQRGQHFDNAREYRRYQALLVERKGRFGVENISTPFKGSDTFGTVIDFLGLRMLKE